MANSLCPISSSSRRPVSQAEVAKSNAMTGVIFNLSSLVSVAAGVAFKARQRKSGGRMCRVSSFPSASDRIPDRDRRSSWAGSGLNAVGFDGMTQTSSARTCTRLRGSASAARGRSSTPSSRMFKPSGSTPWRTAWSTPCSRPSGDPRHRRGPTRRSAEIEPRHGVEQIDRFLSNHGSDVEAMTSRGRDSCSVGGGRSRLDEFDDEGNFTATRSPGAVVHPVSSPRNQPSPADTYRKRSAGLK